MITPGAFGLAAVRHGTTGVVSDPHEIANVLGMDGIRFMIENGKKVPCVNDIELCMKDHGCQNNCPVKAITILPPQEGGRNF